MIFIKKSQKFKYMLHFFFSRKRITPYNEFCQGAHSSTPKLFSCFMIIFEFHFFLKFGKQYFSLKWTNHSQCFSRFVFNKPFADSRRVLYYFPSNVCLLQIFYINFYRLFLSVVVSFFTSCHIILVSYRWIIWRYIPDTKCYGGPKYSCNS